MCICDAESRSKTMTEETQTEFGDFDEFPNIPERAEESDFDQEPTCEHGEPILGENLCWDCFKSDLEHIDVGDDDE